MSDHVKVTSLLLERLRDYTKDKE